MKEIVILYDSMKPLANIVTTLSRLKFKLPINKCSDISEVDMDLPTLIIGYELSKSIIQNFNILKKSYLDGRILWTFNKNEKAVDYEDDLENFFKLSINRFIDNIDYKFIDVITLGFTNAKKLINYIVSPSEKFVFIENNEFIYVYGKEYKVVFGFSLKMAKFLGINIERIISLIKSNKNNRIIRDFSIISNDVKEIIGYKFDKYLALYEYFE